MPVIRPEFSVLSLNVKGIRNLRKRKKFIHGLQITM